LDWVRGRIGFVVRGFGAWLASKLHGRRGLEGYDEHQAWLQEVRALSLTSVCRVIATHCSACCKLQMDEEELLEWSSGQMRFYMNWQLLPRSLHPKNMQSWHTHALVAGYICDPRIKDTVNWALTISQHWLQLMLQSGFFDAIASAPASSASALGQRAFAVVTHRPHSEMGIDFMDCKPVTARIGSKVGQNIGTISFVPVYMGGFRSKEMFELAPTEIVELLICIFHEICGHAFRGILQSPNGLVKGDFHTPELEQYQVPMTRAPEIGFALEEKLFEVKAWFGRAYDSAQQEWKVGLFDGKESFKTHADISDESFGDVTAMDAMSLLTKLRTVFQSTVAHGDNEVISLGPRSTNTFQRACATHARCAHCIESTL